MTGLLTQVSSLPADFPIFATGNGDITAGRIRATARALAPRLAGYNGRVYLHTTSAALFVAGVLAASRAGLVVHLPAHLQDRYLQEINAQAFLLCDDPKADKAAFALSADGDESVWEMPPADTDLVFYTSGVTSTPKEIPKAIAQLDREAIALEGLWGGGAGKVVATVSHQHIYGMLFRIFWPILSGRLSDDRPAENWESLAGKLVDGATLVSSPAHLGRLPPAASLDAWLPGLIFSSGAPLPFDAAQASRDRMGSLPIEVLGSTETGGIAWRQQDSVDALWTPFADVQARQTDAGLLQVTSPFISGDTPIETGDASEFVGKQFRLKGRADNVVKIEGKRVSLTRVEQALLELPFVSAAAAIDLPERKGALGAIVELTDEGKTALAAEDAFRFSRTLRAALADSLEPSERPKHWRFGAIPVNSQGKRVGTVLRMGFDLPSARTFGRGHIAAFDAQSAEVLLDLTPDLLWFEGHFPDFPILPGIAQVHLAVKWAEHLFGWTPPSAKLTRLKFRHVLRPGDKVRLKIARDPALNRLKFAFHLEDVIASEGYVGGDA